MTLNTLHQYTFPDLLQTAEQMVVRFNLQARTLKSIDGTVGIQGTFK